MNPHTLVGAALISLLVITGAALATPGSLSSHVAVEEHAQAARQSDTDEQPTVMKNKSSGKHKTADENETAEANEIAGPEAHTESKRTQHTREGPPVDRPNRAGPPTAMPGGVPDFVSDLHRLIRSFLDGELDGHLGPAIPETLPTEAAQADG